MNTTLIRRSGKFVYARGSEVPLHFLPLQEFSLETAQNHSLIVALRMQRIENQKELIEKNEIAAWRDVLQSLELSMIVFTLCRSAGRLIDYGSCNGLIFEELKLLCANSKERPAYHIVFPDLQKSHEFDGLHNMDEYKYEKVGIDIGESLNEFDTVLVNQASAIRGEDSEPSWESLIQCAAGNIVIALRVASGDKETSRVTVRGREVLIPIFTEICELLRQTGRCWHYRWQPKHDNAFFLPEPGGADVGLFTAYRSEGIHLRGFKLLKKD